MMKLITKLFKTVSSKSCVAQLLFLMLLCLALHLWMLRFVYMFADNFSAIVSVARRRGSIRMYPNNSKFVLVWNKRGNNRLDITDLSKLNCSSNCVFTDNRELLYDYNRFNAIVFTRPTLKSAERPDKRTNSQLYVFSSTEASSKAPACDMANDNFFNLTMTYRLDSDVVWSYFAVHNSSGAMVAPSASVAWRRTSKPIAKEIQLILRRKRKAAVWLVDICNAGSQMSEYMTRLQEHLFQYSLQVDTYGECTHRKCPLSDCRKMIEDDYFFYMAFEDVNAEDFVTDKVLHGYHGYAVPIVYGGANYSRFLPPGSYINALEIHPYNLAYVIQRAVRNPQLIERYFQWTNLYSISALDSKSPLCSLCEMLHSSEGALPLAKEQFRLWWNGRNGMRMCLPDAFWNETSYLHIDSNDIFHLQ